MIALLLLFAVVDEPIPLVAPAALEVHFGEGLWNGRIAKIDVTAPSPIAVLTGSINGKPVIAYPASAEGTHFVALGPVDIETRPRPVPVVLEAVLANGTKLRFTEKQPVQAAPYDERELTVGNQFVQPSKAQRERAGKETRIMDQALAHPSAERLWRGSFAKPTPGVETSPFGTRRTYHGDKTQKHNRHYGWDLNGAWGDPIFAANRGRVALAADRFYSGGTIVIDHGQGLFTMYFHMSRIDVQEGDIVEKGQPLGAVGASGQVTGPHLHFSAKLDGMYQDPKYLLGLALDDGALKP